MEESNWETGVLEDAAEVFENRIKYMAHHERIPGISVAVVKKNEVVYRKDFGYADLEQEEKLGDHSFRIASLSKMFTALTLVKLREEKALSLDNKLSDHLDWIPSEAENIRIKHVMMHCSGLTRDGTADYWNREDFPGKEELENYLDERPPVKEPLQHWKYSNTGYGILGQVIEEVSGKSYSETVEGKILEPLGMDDTEVDPEEREDLAKGYSRYIPLQERKNMEDKETGALAPATGLVSTLGDIARFAASTFTDDFVIDKTDLREMRKTHWDMETGEKWELGFKNMEVADREIYGHSGSFPGHHTSIGICPDEEVAVVVMGNTIDLDVEKTMKTVLHTVLKTKDLYPEYEEEIKDQEKFTGTYADQWGETEVKKINNGLVVYPANTRPLENYLKVVKEDGELKLDGGTGYGYTGEEIQISEDGKTLEIASARYEQIEHFQPGKSALKAWQN